MFQLLLIRSIAVGALTLGYTPGQAPAVFHSIYAASLNKHGLTNGRVSCLAFSSAIVTRLGIVYRYQHHRLVGKTLRCTVAAVYGYLPLSISPKIALSTFWVRSNHYRLCLTSRAYIAVTLQNETSRDWDQTPYGTQHFSLQTLLCGR